MKCTKCGTEIPPGSRFCSGCGSPISSEVSGVVPASHKKSGTLAAIVGLAIVVIAAVLIAWYMKGQRVADVGPVDAPGQPGVLSGPNAPTNRQPGVLQTPKVEVKQPEKKEVPKEVVEYLEHLKKVEEYRQQVYGKELAAVMASASDSIVKALPFDWDEEEPKKPTDELAQKSMDFTREWQQVSAYFLQVQAPPECAQLSQKYYDSLGTFIKFMGRFQDAVSKSDVPALKNIKADAGEVDKKLSDADGELGKVCNKFGIEKNFSIKGDSGQSPMFGF